MARGLQLNPSLPRLDSQWKKFIAFVVFFGTVAVSIMAQNQAVSAGRTNHAGIVLTIEGTVEVVRAGDTHWMPATTNFVLGFGDNLRTGPHSRATVQLSDLSVLRVNEKTVLEIRSQQDSKGSLLDLRSGSTYFFNRSKPSSIQFHTPLVSGAIRGTEFNLAAAENGRTAVTLLEGEVALNNAQGELVLESGEEGIVEPGQPPRKTAVLHAINVIQWSLYYPAVVDLDELGLNDVEKNELSGSLSAYRSGDLLAALASHAVHEPASDPGRVYYAALLLSVGQVDQTEAELKQLQTTFPLAESLLMVIASVKHEEFRSRKTPDTASEWLAQSYYLQSRSRLNEALEAGRAAVKKSPNFGFAWVRVAELEFSLGRVDAARSALERGLRFSPRNPQAFVLQGFLLTAQNKTAEALASFDHAIALDGALANAWLGRGLCKIRQGKSEAGRQDLQVAAALEPNRSDLRSYLGKAWDQTRDRKHAGKELRLAKQLDPNDPTPWLYSALLDYEYNRDNEAVDELEKSKELNGNRGVYRSKLLLDQDQAVRSANLAKIYRDAGMSDVGVREAARAVDQDYANYSAHLFLAESYDALRDPKLVNLRYETPWLSQLLVADLLAPVGSVALSQNVSQQEYSRLFEANHIGMYNDTQYSSRGDWVQNSSQYGNAGNTGFAFDEYYRSENGWRPNNDVNDFNFSARFKQQLTPEDSVFFEANYSDYSSGDVLQYYDQNAASRTLRITETQVPNLFAGYHREWSPGIHTLFLAGRLQDTFNLNDPAAMAFVTTKNGAGQIVGVAQRPASLAYTSDLDAYTAELQQIFQSTSQTLVLGARYQVGDISTHSLLVRSVPADQTISPDLTRVSTYGYYTYQVAEPLLLTAGVSYDHLEYPQNDELSPLTGAENSKDQVSPKAGFRWAPAENTVFRGVWTRSLGGVFYDTSVRLEPTEIAGFNQAFRSVLPESVAGLIPGSRFETFGLAFDQKLPTRTYFNLTGEILKSRGSRTVGTLDAFGPLLLDVPSGVDQSLHFEEKSASLFLDQLVGDEFSVGASYRVSEGSLEDRVPAIPAALSSSFSLSANRDVSATLHQVNLHVLFNHPCGFFSRAEAVWSDQSNHGYAVPLHGDDFWQFNIFAGYRLPRRLAEFQVGVVNINDRDYKLNPLDLYSELPRARTFVASFKFNF